MNIDDLTLVSVDDHVVEPPDMFHGQWAGSEPVGVLSLVSSIEPTSR